MEQKIVGLIRGRHDMPVEKYIFDSSIEDVFNYSGIFDHIVDFLVEKVGIEQGTDIAINEADQCDVLCFRGKMELIVYVTGLTCVTAELIKACAMNGVRLTLMNFDVNTGKYVPQKIF